MTAMPTGTGAPMPHALEPPYAPWLPLVLPLKGVSPSHIPGLLPRHLRDVVGLSAEVVDALRRGTPLPGPGGVTRRFRLLVLCDGYDELQGGMRAVAGPAGIGGSQGSGSGSGFVGSLCGRPAGAWDPSVLKVVVTCRTGYLGHSVEDAVFGQHMRRVLQPLDEVKVGHCARGLSGV